MTTQQLQPPATRLIRARHGNFFILCKDQVSLIFEKYGEWAEKEIMLYQRLLKNAHTILEVGAHIGTHTVPLAALCKQLYCFEPQPLPFQALVGNLLINNISNVLPYPAVVGASEGWIKLQPTDFQQINNSGAYDVKNHLDDQGGISTAMIKLDDFWQRAGQPKVDFMKVDVEGMEEEVLRGAEQILAACRPPMLLENNFWRMPGGIEQGNAFYAWLAAIGYDLFWFCPAGFNPANYYGVSENIVGPGGDVNILAVPYGQEPPFKLPEFECVSQFNNRLIPWI